MPDALPIAQSSGGKTIDFPHALPTFGDYDVIKAVAEGSYGVVWLAKNKLTGTLRALKVVAQRSFKEARPYQREFEAICAFEPISRSHPGFVNILHVGPLPEGFYYVMELADDVDTGQQIDPSKYSPKMLSGVRFNVQETIRVGISLAEAVAALHAKHLLHRDIKPSNIIFVNGQPKLADIGLVADTREARSFVGTEGFVPPEGPTSVQADLFALGKVLYELATGLDRLSFPALPDRQGEDHGLLLELNEVLLKACNDDSKQRYASAHALASDLHLIQSGKSLSRMRQLERRVRVLAKSLAIVVLIGVVAVGAGLEWTSRARRAAEERQRVIATAVARGSGKLSRGEYSAAIEQLLPLLKQDPEHELNHRLRLGSILANTVEPVRTWKGLTKIIAGSRNGKLIATSDYAKIQIHESLTGQILTTFPLKCSSIALNEDATKMAVVEGPILTEYNIPRGQVERRLDFTESPGHVAYGPTNILAVSFETAIETIPVSGKKEIYETDGVEIFRSLFSNTGKYLATSTMDGTFLTWDLATKQPLATIAKKGQILYHALFIGDDRFVITAGSDRLATKWRVGPGDQLETLTEHDDAVVATLRFENPELFVTAGLDRELKVRAGIARRDGRQEYSIHVPHTLDELFVVDSNIFVSFSDQSDAIVWRLNKEPSLVTEISSSPILSKKEIHTQSVSLRAHENHVTGTFNGKPFHLLSEFPIEMIAVDPKEKFLAVAPCEKSMKAHSAKLYKGDTLSKPIELPHKDGIVFIGFSPKGDRIVTCGEDFVAIVWDLNGRPITAPLKHNWQVRCASFSPDGNWVATAGWDRTVIIWDAVTGDRLSTPFHFSEALEYVAFDGPGGLIVSGKEKTYRLKLPLLSKKQEEESLLLHPERLASQ